MQPATTPAMCWAMFGVFVGFCAGVLCSIVSLLLPFPRLASEQMASRIGESHRQVMRYHAVLSCAFVVEARPHVLYSRADRLEELLTASLKNLANLARVSGAAIVATLEEDGYRTIFLVMAVAIVLPLIFLYPIREQRREVKA